ncbi:MAG TPA: helix-turn-helix domain-containing protein [Acidothermaceae bacterium]
MTAPQTRMDPDERRDQVIAAALVEFAEGGLAGTSTEAIAVRAGISQPYLFKMFGTKRDLFIAASKRCFDNVAQTFTRAADGLAGEEALDAMGHAYYGLIADRANLMAQLQMYAACHDLEVRECARDGFRKLYQLVERASGAPADTLAVFFAGGMLCNVSTALGLAEIDEPWARALAGDK